MDLLSPAEERQAEDRRHRRFVIIMSCLFGGLLTGLIGLAVFAGLRDRQHHDRFMSQCMQDHKEYECTVMWRAGDRDSPQQFIFIPTGR